MHLYKRIVVARIRCCEMFEWRCLPCHVMTSLPICVTGISFTPHEVGEHLVNVLRNRQHIPNSPFKIFVGESEIGNASKVKVYGKGLTEGTANETNAFNVNTKDAGAYGAQSDCARVRAGGRCHLNASEL